MDSNFLLASRTHEFVMTHYNECRILWMPEQERPNRHRLTIGRPHRHRLAMCCMWKLSTFHGFDAHWYDALGAENMLSIFRLESLTFRSESVSFLATASATSTSAAFATDNDKLQKIYIVSESQNLHPMSICHKSYYLLGKIVAKHWH